MRKIPVALLLCGLLLGGCAATASKSGGLAATPAPHTNTLVGLGKADLQKRLGTPQLIRRDGPAEVWQYVADACILDLFLYEDGARHRVDYLELRTQPEDAFPPERCFKRILAANPANSLN